MAITLGQINGLLTARGKPEVTAQKLAEAMDFALGFYQLPYDLLYGENTPASVALGVALLTQQADLTAAAAPMIKSKEITGEGQGSIKTTWADAPSDPFPYISGLFARHSANSALSQQSGVSFGRSTR